VSEAIPESEQHGSDLDKTVDGAPAKDRRQTQAIIGVGVVITVVALAGIIGTILGTGRPAPSPAPPATPGPSVDTTGQQSRLDAFLATVTAADRSWRVKGRIDVAAEVADGYVQFDAIVAGADSAASLSGTLVTGDRDQVVKGGRRYLRVDGGTWKLAPRLPALPAWDPFARLDPAVDARFLRWEQKGAQTFGQVSLAGLLAFDPTTYFDSRYTLSSVEEATVTVDIDAKGRPARAMARATVMASDAAGMPRRIRVRISYEFSHVGDPLTVRAPKTG
jgi:hypothetical protein